MVNIVHWHTSYDKQCYASLICIRVAIYYQDLSHMLSSPYLPHPKNSPTPSKKKESWLISLSCYWFLFTILLCARPKWIMIWFYFALFLWYKSLVIVLLGRWIWCHHFRAKGSNMFRKNWDYNIDGHRICYFLCIFLAFPKLLSSGTYFIDECFLMFLK
jgi:hypothetical protein